MSESEVTLEGGTDSDIDPRLVAHPPINSAATRSTPGRTFMRIAPFE